MSEGTGLTTKMIPIIVITWVLSLVTTLAIVYVAPNIFPISVKTDNIVDSAIITTKLADGNVTSAKILDGNLTAVDIADGSIITVKVSNGAVTTDKISDGAITTAKIANSAIVTIKLADGSVTSAKILNGAVTAVDLADDSVINAKIADGAVTTSKMADGNVTDIKLARGAIPMWSKFGVAGRSITTTTWSNDTALTTTVTLNRTSDLLIMYCAEAWLSVAGDWIIIRALVNATDANPRGIDNPVLLTSANVGSTNSGTVTRIFYLTGVSAGTYIVNVQYYMWNGVATGWVHDRTLNIIAFPA